MHLQTSFATGRSFDPVMRGYHIVYRDNSANHCPGCGHSNWMIGRLMAECAFCGTALPREHCHGLGARPRFVTAGEGDEHLPPNPLEPLDAGPSPLG